MRISLRVEEIVIAYNIINDANYNKLEDVDKIKLWKISRALKPIQKQFVDDKNDAIQNLISKEVRENYARAQEYESNKTMMTEEEYNNFLIEFNKCQNLINMALRDSLDKVIEIDFEPLSEDAFGKLMASNDWKMKQVEDINFIAQ